MRIYKGNSHNAITHSLIHSSNTHMQYAYRRPSTVKKTAENKADKMPPHKEMSCLWQKTCQTRKVIKYIIDEMVPGRKAEKECGGNFK